MAKRIVICSDGTWTRDRALALTLIPGSVKVLPTTLLDGALLAPPQSHPEPISGAR